jgi:hemolysin activation/secretion protein
LFGGYAKVKPDLGAGDEDFEDFKSDGHSAQASFRYQIPLGKAYHSQIKEPFFGFDYKNTNNNLEFIGDDTIPIITKTVNITQLVGGFNWGKQTAHHKFTCSLDSYWSPGKILPNQSNSDFDNLRHGAKNRYVYARGTAGDVYHFPVKCALSLLTRGQYSSQNLLPSEQFTIGGYNTVRGYDERELMVDNGFIVNFEIRSHAFHLFRKAHDELLLLAFTDYGIGGNHKKIPGEKNTQYLWGIGPGLRYSISSYLSLRVDWGFKLHRIEFEEGGMSKVHFGVIASY